jgi:hypothetical protein
MVDAYIHSLSPATTILTSRPWIGDVYQPAWYGDGQNYFMPDFIGVFGPLAIYDYNMGNTARLENVRWVEQNTPAGGKDEFLHRISRAEIFRDAILLFMMSDPAAPAAVDPRGAMPTELYSEGLGRILARTDWSEQATLFTYSLGWIAIDHQHGDGNQIEFYRGGEWLTKDRTGWDGTNLLCSIGRSDYHNTLALENEESNLDPDHFLNLCHDNGSQWMYVPAGDGEILANSFADSYVYVSGDATDLYNSTEAESMDIVHASRSALWLKPDHIIIYDRAESRTDGRFKRFWLNFPAAATVDGNVTTMASPKGQKLFTTTLLPLNAAVSTAPAEDFEGDVANDETMTHRLLVEATGGPRSTRFLNVLQGTDASASADDAILVESTAGTAYVGAIVSDACILFPSNLGDTFASTTYTTPLSVSRHFVTGLEKNGKYDVAVSAGASSRSIVVTAGSQYVADAGGVLSFTTGSTDIPDIPGRTAALQLGTAYPNPVVSSARNRAEHLTIPFALSGQAYVALTLFDQNGRQIATVLDEAFSGGSHAVRIALSSLGTGVYFYQFRAGSESAGGSFTIIR